MIIMFRSEPVKYNRTSNLPRILVCSICLCVGTHLVPLDAARSMDFEAGGAVVPIRPPEGISLAGLGNGTRRNWWATQNTQANYLTASEGSHDEIRSKALVLKFGPQKVALVSTDLLMVSSEMHQELWRRVADLGFQKSDIVLTATHTHSGPSSFIRNTLFEFLVTDKYVVEVFHHIVGAIEHSIREADAKLLPARLAVGTREISDVSRNRRKNRPLDSVLTLIRIDRTSGKPLANLINFPIHPTMMGATNLLLSADVAGSIERALERKTGAASLFINGAEGDVSPADPRGAFVHVEALGEKIGDQAFELWQSLTPQKPSRFRLHRIQQHIGPASINVFGCLHLDKWSGKWLPVLNSWVQTVELTGIVIDQHVLVTIPGEPTTSIGLRIKQKGKALGFHSTSIFGLSNDYLGYVLEREEYLGGGYESCASFYGPSFGDRVSQAAMSLLEDLAIRENSSSSLPPGSIPVK